MPTKTPTVRTRKIDSLKAYQMRVKNRMTYQQIADQLGVSKSSVIERLQSFSQIIHSPEDHQAFTNIRVQAMTTIEESLMASLSDPDKIAKASLNNIAYAFQQVHTARRLEEGKSTENKSIITAMLDAAHDSLFAKPVIQPVVSEQPIISATSEVIDNTESDEV